MSLEEIIETRKNKFRKLKEKTGNVFPGKVLRSYSLSEAIEHFSKLSRKAKPISLVGRVFAIRAHGGVVFCDFKDGSLGKKEQIPVSLQAYLQKDILGEEQFTLFEELIDIGDFLEFQGRLFLTKRREKSFKVVSWKIVSKSIRPLPEKWHGLLDVEERFRKRYLDLLMNDEVKTRFILRSKIIQELRNFLNGYGFLEVETPILQPIAGGATAQPFKTRHNTLDIDLFLRIAPELYLKRLLVAGFEKVYELGRNFRNEGIDPSHNPEFTMLEFYEAYESAVSGRDFIEEMFKALVKKIFDKKDLEHESQRISFAQKFNVITFYEVLKRHALINEPEKASREDFRLKAQQFGVGVENSDSKEKIADNIFRKICRPKLLQPTFVVDYPVAISPLAKRKEDNPDLADRFQLIVGGLELVNAFSELNDPFDQKERFTAQQELQKAGDKEAAEFDESFIETMEYGMPPAFGAGIGIDRLVMLFTNTHNIKEVILFPTMKPKG